MSTFKALGVYIFAGGFAVGTRDAGFKIVAHLEKGTYGVETFKKNFPGVPVWQHPVTWPYQRLRDEGIDYAYCNPPCAAWSMAGASLTNGKTSWLTDGRVQCVRDVFTVLERVQPRVLVWESVTQAFTRGRGLITSLARKAHALGYSVTYLFTSAAHHGLPQPRQRFMMFCHKVKLDLPKPTEPRRNIQDLLGIEQLSDGTWVQECPVWGIPPMGDKYYRLARCTPPGEGLRDTWLEINDGEEPPHWDVNSPAFMAHRLELKGSGNTFTSAFMEVHPIWTRYMANSEIGRLCGWPDNYTWCGDVQLVRAQMCQAVLPPVGRYAGEQVKKALERNEPEAGPRVYLANHLEERAFGLS